MQISSLTDPRLIFEVEIHQAEKATGEYKYSLGDPPIPERYEITAVAWDDGTNIVDITNFLTEYADHLFKKWEEQLND
jgi:hypothetical protein